MEKNDLIMIDNKRFMHGRNKILKFDQKKFIISKLYFLNFLTIILNMMKNNNSFLDSKDLKEMRSDVERTVKYIHPS